MKQKQVSIVLMWGFIVCALGFVSCVEESSDACPDHIFSQEGESCVETPDCVEGLFCSEHVCVFDGAVIDGDADGTDMERNNYGLTWVPISSGEFEMGCSEGSATEMPRHHVQISAFEMTQTEITQEQYEFVMTWNPSWFQVPNSNSCRHCPVESITWFDARAFCHAVGGRLPTEAEWEYAVRAGSTTQYPCGDESECADEIGWWEWNGGEQTHPVKGKLPNDYGLYDMSGNVWEWVEDCWHDNYEGAPTDGRAWLKEEFCHEHVIRGGSYHSDVYIYGDYRRSSYRDKGISVFSSESRGFRCARNLVE